MSKMDQAVGKRETYQPREEASKPSEWGKCIAHGCPMHSSLRKDGNNLCTYHANADFADWQNTTTAIRRSAKYINKLSQMTHWSAIEWRQKSPLIANWDFCPMTKDDRSYTLYLTKLSRAISKRVSDIARELSKQHKHSLN